MTDSHFSVHIIMRNCFISTSGLKSDVTVVVFFDPDFLHDAGIPTFREHYRQKLVGLCLCWHGFSAPFGPKMAVLEGKIGEGVVRY